MESSSSSSGSFILLPLEWLSLLVSGLFVLLDRAYCAFTDYWWIGKGLDAYWEQFHEADTFEEWEAAGNALEKIYKINVWRETDVSDEYASDLIRRRQVALAYAVERGSMQSVINLLRSGMTRNLGRITDPKLYRRSFTGTKHLIADYILQVCHVISDLSRIPVVASQPPAGQTVVLADDEAPLHNRALSLGVMQGRIRFQSKTQKRLIFQHMQQSFGRTTLVLQGGSMFGLCHLGVAKALFLRGLLPRVITGSGTGALVAALLGIHSDDELPDLLDGRGINLEAFDRRNGNGNADGAAAAAAAFPSWWSRWATVKRRLLRLIREGHVLDVKVLERLVRDNAGELTFDEAYQRTGRILNITVVAGAKGEVPTVLNYITAPNVLVWSAAVASNVSDPMWYGQRETPILCKDTVTGATVPWPLVDTAYFRHWTYGTTQVRHSPLTRISQLFNVNHFVVSQARPFLVPLLRASIQAPRRPSRWPLLGRFRAARALAAAELRHHARCRLQQAAVLGILPVSARRLMLNESHGPSDSLLLVPDLPPRAAWRLLDRPATASLRYWIRAGERCAWPAVAALKIRCSVEWALDDAVEVCMRDEKVRRGGGGGGAEGLISRAVVSSPESVWDGGGVEGGEGEEEEEEEEEAGPAAGQ